MDQACARRSLSPGRTHRAGACRRVPGRAAGAPIQPIRQGGDTDMTDDLAQQSAARLATLYRKGKASPVETMKAVLARSEKIGPRINAFTRVDAGAALKAARASERRWRKGEPLSALDGVPVSIKELVRAKGWPASMGSKLTDKAPADADGEGVARRRAEGDVGHVHQTGSHSGQQSLHAAVPVGFFVAQQKNECM